MGGTIGRVAMGIGTMGVTEGFGLRPLAEKGAPAAMKVIAGGDAPTNGDLPSPSELSSERANVKKKRAALASTMLTGARGVLGEAPVSSASLIGGNKTLG